MLVLMIEHCTLRYCHPHAHLLLEVRDQFPRGLRPGLLLGVHDLHLQTLLRADLRHAEEGLLRVVLATGFAPGLDPAER